MPRVVFHRVRRDWASGVRDGRRAGGTDDGASGYIEDDCARGTDDGASGHIELKLCDRSVFGRLGSLCGRLNADIT